MKPKFPIISIYNKKGIDIIQSKSTWTEATILAVLYKNDNTTAFDKNGKKWTYEFISDKVNNNFITRFLANTIYNPIVDIKIEWTSLEEYALEDLKKEINKCIDNDDDVLTQFVDAKFLKNEILKSNSFDLILKTLNKYIFDVNEDELWGIETE